MTDCVCERGLKMKINDKKVRNYSNENENKNKKAVMPALFGNDSPFWFQFKYSNK